MNDLGNATDIVKKQSLNLNDGLSDVADAAMELIAKHMQITVKGLASDVKTQFVPYLIPFAIVIPFLIFSIVNMVYKILVYSLAAKFSDQMSLQGIEITASVIILIITLAAGYYYVKKLTVKKPTKSLTSSSKGDHDPMPLGVNQ